MFRQVFLAAIAAGLIVGVLISAVQSITTTPLIIAAEEYELAALETPKLTFATFQSDEQPRIILAHSNADDEGSEAWAPETMFQRVTATLLANVLTAVAYSLLLVGCYAIWRHELSGRIGILWGAAGFTIFTLAPALGLAPELPGSMAADLALRQAWWLGAAAATGLGIWLLVFGRSWAWHSAGIIVMVIPHIVGAPQPDEFGGTAPPELAAHFAAASIVTSAIFWAMLGWFSGSFYQRLGET